MINIDYFKKHKLVTLFLFAFLVHLLAVLFVHFSGMQAALGGTDYIYYQKSAVEISQQFRLGDFSLAKIKEIYPDVYLNHIYPVVVAVLYAVSYPSLILGEMFNAFLCALISVFIYLIMIEIKKSENWAFIIGLIASLYPSLVFNGSLLLKDALTTLLAASLLFYIIRLTKNFSVWQFIIFYILLIPTINLRFYLGYAIILTFIICWFLFYKSFSFKKRFVYILVIILLFGLLPQISAGQGYFGIRSLEQYLNPKTITYYREVAYKPTKSFIYTQFSAGGTQNSCNEPNTSDMNSTVISASKNTQNLCIESENTIGTNSTLNLKTDFAHPLNFIRNYIESFIYVLLGPLPWQIKNIRQLLALLETIPWYFMLYFIIKGIWLEIKNRSSATIPLVVFSLIFLGVIALFDSNFGDFMRIRMPAFICLLCLLPFGINQNKKFLKI
jgi:hypothetical protein